MNQVLKNAFALMNYLDDSKLEYESVEQGNWIIIKVPYLDFSIWLRKDGNDVDSLQELKNECKKQIINLGLKPSVNWSAYAILDLGDDDFSFPLGTVESWLNALNFVKKIHEKVEITNNYCHDDHIFLYANSNNIIIYKDYCVIQDRNRKYNFDEIEKLVEDLKYRDKIHVSLRGPEMKRLDYYVEEKVRMLICQTLKAAGFEVA